MKLSGGVTTAGNNEETFNELWTALKVSLTLTDKDLDVGYKVRVTNGIAVLGWLCAGKVKQHPRYYPHPSNAARAISRYVAKNGDHKCEILKWAEEYHPKPVVRIVKKATPGS